MEWSLHLIVLAFTSTSHKAETSIRGITTIILYWWTALCRVWTTVDVLDVEINGKAQGPEPNCDDWATDFKSTGSTDGWKIESWLWWTAVRTHIVSQLCMTCGCRLIRVGPRWTLSAVRSAYNGHVSVKAGPLSCGLVRQILWLLMYDTHQRGAKVG